MNRGYPKKSALNFVSNHYRLSLDERNILARVVFPTTVAEQRKSKLIGLNDLRGELVGIDGYNVLITVESVIYCHPLFLCDDGVLRDVRAIFGRYRMGEHTRRSLEAIIDVLSEIKPRFSLFLYDSSVSKSGELASLTRSILRRRGVKGNALAVRSPDWILSRWRKAVIATSDHTIMDKCERIVDIPAEICKRLGKPIMRI